MRGPLVKEKKHEGARSMRGSSMRGFGVQLTIDIFVDQKKKTIDIFNGASSSGGRGYAVPHI